MREQIIAAVQAPPSPEQWEKMMREVSADEALKLRDHAIRSLTNHRDNTWSIQVGIAERVLRERGVEF